MKVNGFTFPFWTRVRFPPSPPENRKALVLVAGGFLFCCVAAAGENPRRLGSSNSEQSERLPAISTINKPHREFPHPPEQSDLF